ncbi:hypothetical protein [Aliarcobacter butzleri]|uniref:hypothetical protein n=1 Tax=Aliarcobacter butzleri TaxID=28197 RepID=UPI00344F3817
MNEMVEISYINIYRYKFLKRKLRYFYAKENVFFDYYKNNVINDCIMDNSSDNIKHYQLIELFFKLMIFDKNPSKPKLSEHNIIQIEYFRNILILEFVLNEIKYNKFNKLAILIYSFPKVLEVLNNKKLYFEFTTSIYYEIYNYLLQFMSSETLYLREKYKQPFYIYDEYLNNSFEKTKDIFKRKDFNLESFINILYSYNGSSINFDYIIENCNYKLEKFEYAFSSYFTNVKLDTDIDKEINLKLKINSLKKHRHFFSFFEDFDIDTVIINQEKKEVFPLFVISLRNALLRSSLIEAIRDKNHLKIVKRLLEKFIKNKNESLNNRVEAYIYLIIILNRDIRFKNLDTVFLCHFLCLSCKQTERFIKTKIYLENIDSYSKISDVSMDVKAVRKFYYLLDKTYFEDNDIDFFLEKHIKEDSKNFNFVLRDDLKELLEKERIIESYYYL